MRYQIFVLVLFIIILAFCFFSFTSQEKTEDIVTVEQVKSKITENDSIILVDVRTVSEFDGTLGHIQGARLVPLAELESRLSEFEEFKDTEMILICRSGNRSGKATRLLRENGFNAYNMQGGMLAWNKLLEEAKSDSSGEVNETISE